jgi:hypothetical protein
VEYGLTPLGEALLKPTGKPVAWPNAHFDEVLSHRERFDAVAESSKTGDRVPSTNNRDGRAAG